MTDLVDSSEIEGIVGAERDQSNHLARAVSDQQVVYILHSRDCLDSGIDLRECAYSRALDQGIRLAEWRGSLDTPVRVLTEGGRLVPDRSMQIPTEGGSDA